MEQTATSLSNLQTRAFALLRKWMKKGSLDETETHELVEIQKEILTASAGTEPDSFKSIVETRFDSVDTQFDSLKESMDARFDSIDTRFDSIDTQFDSLKESLDARFDSIDTRFDSIDTQFDSLKESMDARFDSIDTQFDCLEAKLDSLQESVEIWFSIILRWLKILTGVGVMLLLTMAILFIGFLVTGIS